MNGSTKVDFSNTNDMFLYIVPALTLSGFFVGRLIFEKQLEELLVKNTLREKLAGFQSASIVNYAFIEGPSLLGVFAYLETGNLVYMIVSVFLIIYFISLRPTKDKIEINLNLHGEHKSQFNDTNQYLK